MSTRSSFIYRSILPAIAWIHVLGFSVTGAETPVQFDREIRPILSDKCFFCHGPDREHREADLRLDLPDEAASAIEAGDPENSELIRRILAHDESKMPPDS